MDTWESSDWFDLVDNVDQLHEHLRRSKMPYIYDLSFGASLRFRDLSDG